jgi:hypothetical protein
MNTRKEYHTFEELWTCCAQEESRISTKEKSQKKYDDQAFTTKFKNLRNKRKFGSRKKPNREKDMSKYNASTVENMVTTGTIVLS